MRINEIVDGIQKDQLKINSNNMEYKKLVSGFMNKVKKGIAIGTAISAMFLYSGCTAGYSGKKVVTNESAFQEVYKYPGENGFLKTSNIKKLLWDKYDPTNPKHNPSNPNVDGKTMLTDICSDNVYIINPVLNRGNASNEAKQLIDKMHSEEQAIMMFYDPREIHSIRTVLAAAHLSEEKNIPMYAIDMYLFRDPLNKDGYSDDFEAKNVLLQALVLDKKYWNKDLHKLVHNKDYVEGNAKRKLFPLALFNVNGKPVEALMLGADNNSEIGLVSGIYNAVFDDLQKNITDLTKRQYHFKGENIGKAYENSSKLQNGARLYLKTQKK
jgi:hypothetical protein